METAPSSALCQGNVVSCSTAMCGFFFFFWLLLSQVIMVLIAGICVVLFVCLCWFVCPAETCVTNVDFRVQAVPLGGLDGCAPKAVTSASKHG